MRFTAFALIAGLLAAAPGGSGTVEGTGLVDPAVGRWHLHDPSGATADFYYGLPGDVPFTGDWDCDGVDTPGLYRRDGFVYLRNTNTMGTADVTFFFGMPGDVPVAGDFDGDGCDTLAVYRNGSVYLRNSLTTGPAVTVYAFGDPGDTPFGGDFDGDGIDEIGLHRATNGFVYLRFEHAAGTADARFFYGVAGDRLFTGDFDGDGIDTVGVFRPGETTVYLRDTNSQGPADRTERWGEPDWLPVAGRFGSLPAPAGRIEVIEEAAWSSAPTGPFVSHQIDEITVHHSAVALEDNRDAPAHLRGYQRYHQQAGWPDIAYHLLIDRNGNVYEGRPLWAKGDTFTEYDPTGHLLVLVDGDFDRQEPTAAQLDSLVLVLAWAAGEYGVDPAAIEGHRHYAATSCPGRTLDARLDEIRFRVAGVLADGPVQLDYLRGAGASERVAAIERGE